MFSFKNFCQFSTKASRTIQVALHFQEVISLENFAGYNILQSGLLTGCGQKWGIVRHCEGQLCGKNYQLCGKLCGSQFLISNVLGGAKSCLKYCIQIYLPAYTNALFSPEISPGNQHAYYMHVGRFLFIYGVISITSQNYEVEQLLLPVLSNMENKSRQNVCLTSCIISGFSRCTVTLRMRANISATFVFL